MAKQTSKSVAGVKFGKLTSFKKPRTYPGPGHGRSGPPMVNVGGKKERVGSAKSAMPVRKKGGLRFGSAGSVSERTGHTGPSSIPTIGKQSGHGSFASLGIKRSH